MKLYCSLLALAAIAPAAAFNVQTPKSRSGALFSAPPATGGDGPMAKAAGLAAPGKAKAGDATTPVVIQGESLRTWSFTSAAVERVQVIMKTEGRPLDTDIELWQGPDNTPQKMRVYVEDGKMRTFNCIIETPRGPNTVCIRNTAHLEFPLYAGVAPIDGAGLESKATPRTIQGGALRTYPFEPNVESVKVVLQTDGRPLNSRIELLQGPNNIKQVMELYTEDGMDRPFVTVLETPGSGNVVRIVNTATMEFPLVCQAEPFLVGDMGGGSSEAVMGGDGPGFTPW
eukprot:scaffold618_cov130-Cylindrotheca_fusiformis.AAC.9